VPELPDSPKANRKWLKNANRKIFSIKTEQISRVTTFSGCADQGLRPLIPSQLPKANYPQDHQVGKK
jgi:hypothetical protein